MIYLYLSISALVGYLIGNINFARIFSLLFAKKDITTVGSKNPGTMNMLRTRGLGEALLTLAFEAIKSGIPALGSYFLFEHFFEGYGYWAFFIVAFAVVVGHCFPVFYKFKGGKGVACTFGMFLFNPTTWWMSLIMIVVCFVLFLFIEYPFIISFSFMIVLNIFSTCAFILNNFDYWIALVVIVWLNFALIVFMHRGNIKRFVTGKENKVNFREKIFKRREKKKEDETISDEEV